MECDNSISETCEMLGSFELIEEVINSVYGKICYSFPSTGLTPRDPQCLSSDLRRER
jgi:hypothetical protein